MKINNKQKQAGFTVVEGLIIVVVLVVLGFAGRYVWNKHQASNAKAHASSYGALMSNGTSFGTAYACRGTSHIKITSVSSYSSDNYMAAQVWSEHGTFLNAGYSSGLRKGASSFLVGYNPGKREALSIFWVWTGGSSSKYPTFSATSEYRGARYKRTIYDLTGSYPAVDGLPSC